MERERKEKVNSTGRGIEKKRERADVFDSVILTLAKN